MLRHLRPSPRPSPSPNGTLKLTVPAPLLPSITGILSRYDFDDSKALTAMVEAYNQTNPLSALLWETRTDMSENSYIIDKETLEGEEGISSEELSTTSIICEANPVSQNNTHPEAQGIIIGEKRPNPVIDEPPSKRRGRPSLEAAREQNTSLFLEYLKQKLAQPKYINYFPKVDVPKEKLSARTK